MRKNIIISIISIILIIAAIFYINSKTVDTRYAIKYAQVFGSYDIKKVDHYLNEETLISYNGVTNTYKHLRDNVIAAFKTKEYKMTNDSYGNGDDVFINGIQNIGIQTYVVSDKYTSEFVSMDLKCRWFVFYDVKSISSNDDFFGYLFFGITK